MVTPQAMVVVSVLTQKVIGLMKRKTPFYTEDDVKNFFIGPEFDISSRLGYVLQVVFVC